MVQDGNVREEIKGSLGVKTPYGQSCSEVCAIPVKESLSKEGAPGLTKVQLG